MTIEDRERHVSASRTFRNIRELYRLSDKTVFDVGCGFGEYLRFFGEGSVGITTTHAEIEYGKKHGLDIMFWNAEKLEDCPFNKKFDTVWANNLFEHLLSPHAFLMKLKKYSCIETVIILGVPVVPKISSLTTFKWFRGALATNHINFFTHTILRLTVERAGWSVQVVRPFIFKNILLDSIVRPFAPHVYVVAKNSPDFKYPFKKVNEWIADEHYADLLSITQQK